MVLLIRKCFKRKKTENKPDGVSHKPLFLCIVKFLYTAVKILYSL